MTCPTPKNYQISYQTHGATDADHQALSTFFAVIDAAQSRGKQINHSKRPDQLMIHLGQLYDVAEELGYTLVPQMHLLSHLTVLTYPRYQGKCEIKTPLWPNAKTIPVIVMGAPDSDAQQTLSPDTATLPAFQEHTMYPETQAAIEQCCINLRAQIDIWADTVESVPPGTRISYDSTTLLTQLEHLQHQLDTLISLTAPTL